MKSILCNISEWVNSIASSKLDNLMMLRPLFEQMLAAATISRTVTGKSGMHYLVYTKIVGLKTVKRVDVKDASSVSPEEKFPRAYEDFYPADYEIIVHIPRLINERVWGFVSTYGKTLNSELPCSYTGFVTYLNQIVDLMGQQALLQAKNPEESAKVELVQNRVEGEIHWNINTNEVIWGEKALEILGYTDELEKKIYRNMELYDRVYEEDISVLREYLLGDKNPEITIQVRYRHKSREIVDCELQVQGENENQFTIIKISAAVSGD